MLTSIGRAAARRVVSVNRTLTNGTPTFVARPLAVRTLTTSQWNLMAAEATATKPAKAAPKVKTTTKKTTTTTTAGRGRPKKGTTPAKAKKPKVAKKKVVKKKKVIKKKVVKKPKPAKKVVLTPEQAEREKVRKLKKTALMKEEPLLRKPTLLNVYVQQQCTGTKGTSLAVVAAKFKELSTSELETLARERDSQHEQNKKTHAAWLSQVPVEDIYMANLARNHLRRLSKSQKPLLQDERLPKRPNSAFNAFVHRETAGTNRNIRDISSQWANMSQAEKDTLAPEYQEKLKEYTIALDVVRQMAKTKVRQNKKNTSKVTTEVTNES